MTRPTTNVLGILALLALPLGACAPDRVVTGSTYPMDYRERHPVVLAHGPKALDVFTSAGGIDPRQREDIEDFAIEYRRYGEGAMRIEVPEDRRGPTRRSLSLVRSALADAGVSGSRSPSHHTASGTPACLSDPAVV